MSTLKEKNQNHIFTITTELDPPKKLPITWMLSISLTAPWQKCV